MKNSKIHLFWKILGTHLKKTTEATFSHCPIKYVKSTGCSEKFEAKTKSNYKHIYKQKSKLYFKPFSSFYSN